MNAAHVTYGSSAAGEYNTGYGRVATVPDTEKQRTVYEQSLCNRSVSNVSCLWFSTAISRKIFTAEGLPGRSVSTSVCFVFQLRSFKSTIHVFEFLCGSNCRVVRDAANSKVHFSCVKHQNGARCAEGQRVARLLR
jgi:hypothetical protein